MSIAGKKLRSLVLSTCEFDKLEIGKMEALSESVLYKCRIGKLVGGEGVMEIKSSVKEREG